MKGKKNPFLYYEILKHTETKAIHEDQFQICFMIPFLNFYSCSHLKCPVMYLQIIDVNKLEHVKPIKHKSIFPIVDKKTKRELNHFGAIAAFFRDLYPHCVKSLIPPIQR